MTSESFPVDGNDGFTISDWADYYASSDGPAENYTADALTLSLIDSGSICRLNAGASNAAVDINGYRLRIPAGGSHDLPCPVPTTGTVTYYIVGYYDPLLNVANADDSAPRPLGPCRFGLWSSSDIGTALAGKPFVLLKALTRTAGQKLTDAVVTDYMRFLGGPVLDWPALPGDPPVGQFAAPRGSLRLQMDTRKILLRTAVDLTNLGWVDVLNRGPFPFPAPSSLVSRDGVPSTPQYLVHGGVMVKCRGTLKRSDGKSLSSGNDVNLGRLPVGFRPAFTERFICKVGPGKDYGEVRVAGGPESGNTNDSGTVTLTGDSGVDWIDLSPINFRAEF